MQANEKKFFDYWKANVKGKAMVSISLITEAFQIYHNMPYAGGTCGVCIRNEAAMLKNIFERLEAINDMEYLTMTERANKLKDNIEAPIIISTNESDKVEEPKVEEPKVEEPKVEEPKVEEPKVEEPKVEAPAKKAKKLTKK